MAPKEKNENDVFKQYKIVFHKIFKIASLIMFVFGISFMMVGVFLVLSTGESMYGFLVSIGASLFVAGGVSLFIKYMETENYVRLSIEQILKTININELLEKGREEVEIDFKVGIKDIYRENYRLLLEARQKSLPVYIYAVGGELDDPNEEHRELLYQIVQGIRSLLQDGIQVRRIQVINAPIKWLKEMWNLTLMESNPLNMVLTNDDPFIPQVVIVENYKLLLLPTETELEAPVGIFIKYCPESPIPVHQHPVHTHLDYFNKKFYSREVQDSQEIRNIIQELLLERRKIIPHFIKECFLIPKLRNPSERGIEYFDSTGRDWRIVTNEFKRKLITIVSDPLNTEIRRKLRRKIHELGEKGELNYLYPKEPEEIITQVDLAFYKEIIEKAIEKQNEVLPKYINNEITLTEAIEEYEVWSENIYSELTWEPS